MLTLMPWTQSSSFRFVSVLIWSSVILTKQSVPFDGPCPFVLIASKQCLQYLVDLVIKWTWSAGGHCQLEDLVPLETLSRTRHRDQVDLVRLDSVYGCKANENERGEKE